MRRSLLFALTGCFGGSQSTAAESSPNPTATASPTRHLAVFPTATPALEHTDAARNDQADRRGTMAPPQPLIPSLRILGGYEATLSRMPALPPLRRAAAAPEKVEAERAPPGGALWHIPRAT